MYRQYLNEKCCLITTEFEKQYNSQECQDQLFFQFLYDWIRMNFEILEK